MAQHWQRTIKNRPNPVSAKEARSFSFGQISVININITELFWFKIIIIIIVYLEVLNSYVFFFFELLTKWYEWYEPCVRICGTMLIFQYMTFHSAPCPLKQWVELHLSAWPSHLMYPTWGLCCRLQRYETLSFQPTLRGSFHSSCTWSLVFPVCHKEFLKNSPGPVLDFTASMQKDDTLN